MRGNALLLLALGASAAVAIALSQSAPPSTGSSSAGPGSTWTHRGWTLAALNSRNASPVQASNLAAMVDRVLIPLQTIYGVTPVVTSGARDPGKNDQVDGSPTSGHLTGEALDLKVPGWSAWKLAEAIRGIVPSYDQIIAYATSRGGHVHVGIRLTTPGEPRRMLMVAPAGSSAEVVSPATYAALQFAPDSGMVT